MQVNFIIVGPLKTGTSWVYNYLSHHQQISLPTTVKETYFFDRQDKYDRGLNWYFSYFQDWEQPTIKGEVAPTYFHSLEAPARIYQVNPQCKIIVILREPVSRLVSFYRHMMQRSELKSNTSFKEALREQGALIDTSLYYFHLSRWIDTFGKDNIKIIPYELLVVNPEAFADRLCQEIGINPADNNLLNLSCRVNESKAPKNYLLSKLVYQGTKLFHDRGLHKLVNLGKQLGLKQILFKKNSQKLELDDRDFAYTLSLIKDDIQKLEASSLFDLSSWKKIWHERGITFDKVISNKR
jgi:hypothetical protein